MIIYHRTTLFIGNGILLQGGSFLSPHKLILRIHGDSVLAKETYLR
jgi:hypothetical protein